MADKIKINRDSLAKITSDHDTIKQLELLIKLVNSLELSGEETLEETILRLAP